MRLRVLGGWELVAADGTAVADVTRQTRLLLAVLALARPTGVPRTVLCELFWPDRPPAQGRNSLRQALTSARKALGSPAGGPSDLAIDSDLETVRLAAEPAVIDVDVFLRGLDSCDAGLLAAARAYRGELLSGIALSEEVERFVSPHRRSLAAKAQRLAEQLSKTGGDPARQGAALDLAERLLRDDPASEEVHRALMRIHATQGRMNAALKQFESCKAALRHELDTDPDEETVRLFASLQTGDFKRDKATAGMATPTTPSIPAGHLVEPAMTPSLVIMPFDNLGDPSDEYFADGVVEEITAALSRIRDFRVIARQSAFVFKNRVVDLRDVARDLGVSYVVGGSVRRGGDRLRLSVQLVDAVSCTQLWSDRYEGTTGDFFEFQDRIAAQVAGALNPAIRHAEIEASRRKPPNNLKAYDLVMRAFPDLWGQNADAIDQAIRTLGDAVALDPHYGRAHALLAWCHGLRITYLWTKDVDREVAAAQRAIAHSAGRIGDDPTALTAAGAATGFCGDQLGASLLVEQALALDPNNAWAWCRWGWIGIYLGQPDEAAERFRKSMALSPLDPFAFNARMGLAGALARSGRFEEAIRLAMEVTKKHPEVTWAHRLLASWAAMGGDVESARMAARNLLAVQPDFTIRNYLSIPTFRTMPDYRGRLAQGLRDAGLPEG